ATLNVLQAGLVDRRKWLRESDISDALAFTQPLPGSIGVKMVAFLGWRLRGWPGALVATIAYVTPAMLAMSAVAAFALALPDQPWVEGALTGIQVAVVGLIVAAMLRLARSKAKTPQAV